MKPSNYLRLHRPSFLQATKLCCVLAGAVLLGACSSTQPQSASHSIMPDNVQQIDSACKQEALQMQASAKSTGITPQYLTSADTLMSCIQHLPLRNSNKNLQQDAMQVMAMASLNYLKGGDAKRAIRVRNQLAERFPNQDLYLADYTSFIDTLTALTEGYKLSPQELAALNISRQVRDEVERQQYWLNR